VSNLLLYVVTVLVWGSTWIAIEAQLGTVAPEVSVFYRYVLASGALFAWCLLRGMRLRFDRSAHLYFGLLGLLLFSLNYVLTYYAQEHITSALTAIAFSTMLWMNIFNARLFFGTRAGSTMTGGSMIGILGVTVLFLPEIGDVSLENATLYGTVLALVGAFVASLGNMVSQSAQKRGLPIVQSNAWGMFYGALLTAIFALLQGIPFAFDWSAAYVLSLAYLAIFGSIIGFGAYLTLLGRIGASKAGYTMVMFPIVALVISAIAGETVLTWNMLAGVALVLAGNVLVLRARGRVTSGRQSLPLAGRFGRYVVQRPR